MNSAALLMDGAIKFVQSKMLLPTYDVFDEVRNFAPARHQDLFSFCGKRMALTICEDAWNDKQYWLRQRYRRDPVEELIRQHADLIVTINASPFNLGKRRQRHEMFESTAKRFHAPVVYVNQVGGNDQLVFDGSSFAAGAITDETTASRARARRCPGSPRSRAFRRGADRRSVDALSRSTWQRSIRPTGRGPTPPTRCRRAATSAHGTAAGRASPYAQR